MATSFYAAFATLISIACSGSPQEDAITKAFLEQMNVPREQAFFAPLPAAGSAPRIQADSPVISSPTLFFENVHPGVKQAPSQGGEVEAMRKLFPGPVMFEIDSGSNGAMPFDSPDPMVMDMLGHVNDMMQDIMFPALHRQQGSSQAPASCHQDLQTHCATARSQVHCLGQHSADVSENCRKDVGSSVPYLCSHAIDKHCDILQVGLLDCLHGHLAELPAECADAVMATSKAITKLNTDKASSSWEKVREVIGLGPTKTTLAPASSAEREKHLDSKLAGYTTKAPSMSDAIKQAEQKAEAQLDADAEKITQLLEQMSSQMAKESQKAASSKGGLLHFVPTGMRAVVIVVAVLLVIAWLISTSTWGRAAMTEFRAKGSDGKPLLGRELPRAGDDSEVIL
eukprot:TRINITY_DN11179_c0_g1_i1.p1 TRINITY_DN11179_c0_g1~~TRINITY_DN11179_c0_g1_i1.p1  ORF type:complete len:398 (-),score=105.62 TRINITY_DN11179_c0_g1_i1:53-1246(-)